MPAQARAPYTNVYKLSYPHFCKASFKVVSLSTETYMTNIMYFVVYRWYIEQSHLVCFVGVSIKFYLENLSMLNWSVTFLILAIVAAVLGFGGIAAESAYIAKILFVVFLVVGLIGWASGRRVRLQ